MSGTDNSEQVAEVALCRFVLFAPTVVTFIKVFGIVVAATLAAHYIARLTPTATIATITPIKAGGVRVATVRAVFQFHISTSGAWKRNLTEMQTGNATSVVISAFRF